MSKLFIYGDVHWSTYSSIVRSRGRQYSTLLEALIKSVNWSESLAKRHSCDKIICLGDFFDRPDLTAEELSALNAIQWADEIPHTFIVGNHEITTASLEFNSANVLRNRGFNVVDGPQLAEEGHTEILFLPYIGESNRKPLAEYWSEVAPQEVRYYDYTPKRVIISHNDLKNVQYGSYASKEGFDLDEIEAQSDLYINGHIHNGMFVNNKETILNLGILSGKNFNEDAFRHDHLVCILDTETLELTFFENPHALNFYKFDIDKESDLKIFDKLKNNACITVRVESDMLSKVREIINTSDKIVEHRVMTYRTSSTIAENAQVDIKATDHLKQFYDFILTNVDEMVVPKDVLVEELTKVVY